MNKFKIEMLSPKQLFFSGEIVSLTVPLVDGLAQVLANHACGIATVVEGKVTVTIEGRQKKYLKTNGGVLNITKDKTSLLCSFFEWIVLEG